MNEYGSRKLAKSGAVDCSVEWVGQWLSMAVLFFFLFKADYPPCLSVEFGMGLGKIGRTITGGGNLSCSGAVPQNDLR